MKTLAIETSCDDTSVGIIQQNNGTFSVECMFSYSQIANHQQYGGVVPEIASRLHSEKIIALLQHIGLEKIKTVDSISVTTEPGLPGSLLVGKTVAQTLSLFLDIPLIPVNHIHGHIFSIFLDRNIQAIDFPLVTLSVSGGHNDLYLIERKEGLSGLSFSDFSIQKLGSTLDDAAGECFDKVSRMLGGPYPGGKRIADQAKLGKPNKDFEFKRIFLSSEERNFSFSGMKSKIYYLVERLNKEGIPIPSVLPDIAYEFQQAIAEMLGKKLVKAAKHFGAKSLGLVGGVSANESLRAYINEYKSIHLPNVELFTPKDFEYCTDNAAMIGVVGLINTK